MVSKQVYTILTIAALVVIIIVGICSFTNTYSKLQTKYDNAVNNEKTLMLEQSNLNAQNRTLKLSIEQMKYFNDSINDELMKTKDSLGISNKNLLTLQAIYAKGIKKDTVLVSDTIFKNTFKGLDTTIGNYWFCTNLILEYPNVVKLDNTFKSETHIITSNKKETINPPKKSAFLRWFQKKQTVVIVDIEEKNPYIEIEKQRYIEIIK